IQQAETEAQRLISEAEANKNKIEIEAKNEALRIQEENERNAKKRRLELDREEERQTKRREEFDKRLEKFEQREKELNRRQSNLDKRNNELQKLWDERTAELERVAEMTREEARQELLAAVEKDTRQDMVRLIRQIEEEAKSEADNRARDIIALSIQRLASDQVSEIAVSVVPLPSDDMKGRIIGRAGRNIRAFEQATGVDVVVDDTPEAVTISSFDPVRREVAKRALSKLVLDGRIHPARIEKLVEDTRKEVERAIREEGERASYEAGVPGLHPEILKLLGKLKFRTSYGQNMHAHAIETAHLAGMIAAELGADVNLSKAGGLLHDIGKAIDHEVEGPHAIIGAEFCKRYGVPEKIVNCIASHHHEVPQESVEALIVEAADAISGARPGARRESLDAYIKRVRMLEDIANAFTGVEQSYALQAGREVRIMVRPDDIDDLAAVHLARDISKKIEETMQYPGQIKVTIIRETRAVDYAR
ncbi:MAG: ribonuclease Y, partial [Anaerolineae bacterium]